jgi:lipopolysaccharide/colanic/teichoic acid biosynthesis glycosyltransferase
VSLALDVSAPAESPVFAAERLPRRSAWARRARRALDLAIAAPATVLVALPAVAICVAIKSSSRGPCLFVQERVGRGGQAFSLFKFRTMRDGTHAQVLADPLQHERYRRNGFKLPPDDPRITPVGRFLRTTSLDELPQLLNVIRGEMSIVGVRPLVPAELAIRTAYDRALYTTLTPGMTGLWQVEGRSSVGDADRQQLDRRYLEQWTLSLDLRILARTPGAVARTDHAR